MPFGHGFARKPELTWGAASDLASKGKARTRYLAAIRSADTGNFGPLITFAMS